jgi:hypothetical protein
VKAAFSCLALPPVGAAEGCDLLILLLKNNIKRSQPAAAPTGVEVDLSIWINIRPGEIN